MAVNYAEKYSAKVDEAFALESVTENAVNQDYDWDGVSTVYVYGMGTAPLNDYNMDGTSRYGTPSELGNSKQALTVAQDKSFTFTIDRKNYTDTMMTMEAGKALRREIDQVVTPEVDKYRLGVIAQSSNGKGYAVVNKTNAYEKLLEAKGLLGEKKVPRSGTVCYCTYTFYNLLKLDNSFIKAGDLSQDMLIKGQLGDVDGVAIIPVPSDYLPENAAFILTNKIACTAPMKLVEYRTHENPPGISGWLVEGRVIYDAFVLNNKKDAIYVHYNMASAPTVS